MQTQPLTLKTAIGTYGHTRALKDGSIAPQGITLDHVEVTPIIAAFRRMIRNEEFDISEMAISTYICAKAFNKPFTAIPIFPLRSFQHGSILVNTRSRVSQPTDLEGKRVGVRAYTVTGGIWVRGILANEYGVDLSKITWVVPDEEHVQEFKLPRNVQKVAPETDLKELLLSGDIAAAIGTGPIDSPDVAPLIPNAQDAAISFFRRTGVYPINHMVVVKNSVLKDHGWVTTALFDAFARAKREYLQRLNTATDLTPQDENVVKLKGMVGPDPFPYGVAANRATLSTMIRYNVEQGVIPRRYEVEELFAPNTLSME
ncbi:MAG TPA: ABC transporter substrate-binding protein [Chloroflexota bacterium]|nr:ABC transporter substrate-binding protein [Chloroflexota bacterium]